MGSETKLQCRVCDWEATVDTAEAPVEASQAAIDHYLVFGHAIERTDMRGKSIREKFV